MINIKEFFNNANYLIGVFEKKKIKELVNKMISENNFNLDFNGVSFITTHFIDEFLPPLIKHFNNNLDKFLETIKIKNANEIVKFVFAGGVETWKHFEEQRINNGRNKK